MGLKRNGNNYQDLPLRFRGGRTYSFVYSETNKSQLRNIFVGGVPQKGGLNAGALPPSAWVLPQKSGLIASFTDINGNSDVVGALAGALNAASTIANTSTCVAVGFTTANLASTISGVGGFTAAATIVVGGSATISNSGNLTGALVALGYAEASVVGNCSLTVAASGPGTISAVISNAVELSPDNLSQAVWNYSKTNPTTANTMKDELQKAKIAAENAFAVSS